VRFFSKDHNSKYSKNPPSKLLPRKSDIDLESNSESLDSSTTPMLLIAISSLKKPCYCVVFVIVDPLELICGKGHAKSSLQGIKMAVTLEKTRKSHAVDRASTNAESVNCAAVISKSGVDLS